MKEKTIYKVLFLFVSLTFFHNCSTDDLEPTLKQDRDYKGTLETINDFRSVLGGLHNVLTDYRYYGRNVIIYNEVRSDNCFSNGHTGRFVNIAEFAYHDGIAGDHSWFQSYRAIANANIIINTDIEKQGIKEKDEAQYIQGQALMLRALAHYDLLRFFGQQHASGSIGVPIVLTFKEGDLYPKRNTVNEVKEQVYKDLEEAYRLMGDNETINKVLPSKFAVKALESRVAIYFGDWDRARDAAKLVIDSGKYSIIDKDSYVSSWKKKENINSIFELAFSADDNQNPDSLAFIYRYPSDAKGGYGDVVVNDEVKELYEKEDVRSGILGTQEKGETLRNMGKYPDTANHADNIPLIRYEEVILNYAEALLETGNLSVAKDYLNKIPTNRGASIYDEITKDNIIKERRKELIFEGFRFDDLMRTKKAIKVDDKTTLNYPNKLFALLIPDSEMNANSNMVQNDR